MMNASSRSQDFPTLFRRGNGRAVLLLQDGGAAHACGHRDLVLGACLSDPAFEPQWEDLSPEFLFDVVLATGEPGFYADAIATWLWQNASPSSSTDGDAVESATLLAAWLARHGFDVLRPALYRWHAARAVEREASGARALVAMDGAAGLAVAAEALRFYPVPEEDGGRESQLIDDLSENMGAEKAADTLRRFERDGNTAVIAMLDRVDRFRTKCDARATERRASQQAPPTDYEGWRALVRATNTVGAVRLSKLSASMSDDIGLRNAADLVAETDAALLMRYLRLFERQPFPLPPAPLIRLVRDHEDARVRRAAVLALGQCSDPAIRQLALERIAVGDFANGVSLLLRSPAPDDADLLHRVLTATMTDDERHVAGFSAMDYISAHPHTAGAELPLLALYELSPCGICRYKAVKMLARRGPLSAWLVGECRYDNYTDTRELIQRIAAGCGAVEDDEA
jgi:hypothetical protein